MFQIWNSDRLVVLKNNRFACIINRGLEYTFLYYVCVLCWVDIDYIRARGLFELISERVFGHSLLPVAVHCLIALLLASALTVITVK